MCARARLRPPYRPSGSLRAPSVPLSTALEGPPRAARGVCHHHMPLRTRTYRPLCRYPESNPASRHTDVARRPAFRRPQIVSAGTRGRLARDRRKIICRSFPRSTAGARNSSGMSKLSIAPRSGRRRRRSHCPARARRWRPSEGRTPGRGERPRGAIVGEIARPLFGGIEGCAGHAYQAAVGIRAGHRIGQRKRPPRGQRPVPSKEVGSSRPHIRLLRVRRQLSTIASGKAQQTRAPQRARGNGRVGTASGRPSPP